MPVQLPDMTAPPVAEVVCGIFFAPLFALDALTLGAYWGSRRKHFPIRRVLSAVTDEEGILLGDLPPLRSWMVSESGEYLLQLQQDRFYLNWRAGKDRKYPRFQDTNGRPGIVSLVQEEFERFGEFCEREAGERPTIVTADLAKINLLVESIHWRTLGDISRLLPLVASYGSIMEAELPNFNVRLLDKDNWSNTVTVMSGREVEGEKRRLVRLEIRARRDASGSSAIDALTRLNEDINGLFARLIPQSEMKARFGGEP